MTRRRNEGTAGLVAVVGAAAAGISLPAAVLAAPLALFAGRARRRWLPMLGVAAAAAFFTWRPLSVELKSAWLATTSVGLASDPGIAFESAWPHLWRAWLLALPLAPVYALGFELLRLRSVREAEDRRERSTHRRLARSARSAERRAERISARESAAVGPVTDASSADLITLGARAAGDRILTAERRRRVAMPSDWLRRHVLVIGPSGSGKTETLLRLAYGAARLGWSVYYLDAKGEPSAARRFEAALRSAGVEPHAFPTTRLDGWRGDSPAIYSRLIGLVAFATEGDGAYYRDVAKHALWVACNGWPEVPRSSEELLERLAPKQLRDADTSQALAAADARAVGGVELRYRAFFGALAGALDGDTSFEDADAMYLLLDALRLREETHSLARFLIEDFADFAVARKPRDQRALLIIDEYSAVAEAGRVVELVERVRSYNVGVVLAPQVEAGMGGDAASDRVIQNTDTVFLHGLKRPEGIVSLAGTRWRLETSYQHDREHATGFGSSRPQHQYRVDPNEVRALEPGECFVIRRGRAERIKVARVPMSHEDASPLAEPPRLPVGPRPPDTPEPHPGLRI